MVKKLNVIKIHEIAESGNTGIRLVSVRSSLPCIGRDVRIELTDKKSSEMG